jgi:hypothetical protein
MRNAKMNKIPKIIHYCWFGGSPLTPLALKCIESWKKYCPDYEIKEWNESNFDVNMTNYSKEAAKAGKWAFVSDILRFYAVYNYGGVYLDVDVELIKPIDAFLNNSMFIGFESHDKINTGQGFGAEKNFYLIKKMLESYNDVPFVNSNGTLNTVSSPAYTSKIMEKQGCLLNNKRQSIQKSIEIYPTEYFCPKNVQNGDITITENTHSIHHFDGSWLSTEQKRECSIITKYRKKYGNKLGIILYVIIAVCTFRKSAINNITEKIKFRASKIT